MQLQNLNRNIQELFQSGVRPILIMLCSKRPVDKLRLFKDS